MSSFARKVELSEQLVADGLLRRTEHGGLRTTRRWQAAMARAAVQLLRSGTDANDGADLRVPIAYAFVEIYGRDLTDEQLAELVGVMVAIEARELDPRWHLQSENSETTNPSR